MKPVALIAASDRAHRDHCRHFFARRGFHVRTASSGLECLKMIFQEAPFMLLVDFDILWGGADGVLACLRNTPELLPQIRFIGATGAGCPAELSVCSQLPLANCFQKPVAPEAILGEVLTVAASGKLERQLVS